ncbi:hypothetical protein [Streptomyces sp. NPDC045470]|uniref:hypothetical protein n=1 Tax=Streptomyces sp. NPDC045470 TaxID=3155469 RepID=UPI0033F8418C
MSDHEVESVEAAERRLRAATDEIAKCALCAAYAAVSGDVHEHANEQWLTVDGLEENHKCRAHPEWYEALRALTVAKRAAASAAVPRSER